ncbi:MAG: DUF1295 domain-containing protein [Solirubrobacterales bacterium]
MGAAVRLLGLAQEWPTADLQLARFAEPDSGDKVMTAVEGLVATSQLLATRRSWWGILIALATGSARGGRAIGPIVMTTFLLKVSASPWTEKTISSRRPGYAEYERTSAFIPLPPKR